jgi:hypothetical protein
MRRLLALATCAPMLFAASAQAAASTGYAHATGYFKKDSRPTLYQPLNLLDAREATAWCSATPDYLNDTITFGFKGLVKLDEVRIYTGNGFDKDTFQSFSRARKLRITGPERVHELQLSDERGLQAVTLNPPIEAEYVTLEVLDSFAPSDDPDVPTCLTDVIFYQSGRALSGRWMTPKLKYDKARANLLGTWFSGHEGAPDRSVSFFFDGTFRMVYEPYEGRGRIYSGEYRAAGSRLTLEVPGKGSVSGRMQREKKEDPRGRGYRLLTIKGPVPEDFRSPFRDKRILDGKSASSDFP